jgi:acyl-CoA thioester hydrolase
MDGAGAPTPFREHRTRVRPEWVDYNGHMNDSAYAVVLGDANEALLEALGLSAEYRGRTGAAMFTVESHIRYLAECTLGQLLAAASLLVSADARKLRVCTELLDEGGEPVATGEYLYLHVDSGKGKSTAMPADRQAAVDGMLSAHAALPRPDYLGRGISTAPSTAPSTEPAER